MSTYNRRRFLGGAIATGLALRAPLAIPPTQAADPTTATTTRLDPANLLVYRDAHGKLQPVESQADWLLRRRSILDAAQEVMGPLPQRQSAVPLDVKIEREVDEGSYVQQLISYSGDAGDRVPAYLLIPKRALAPGAQAAGGQLPGVLSPLGTGMSATAFGEQAMQSDGLPRWDDARDYPRELAEEGFVTLVAAYPHLGQYRPDLQRLGYQSGTMKAIWNNIRGLDLLESLPYVRRGSYGSIGHSLGGHNSIYTAVFDQRIKVVVSSCGFDSYRDYMDGDISGWAQERYMPKIKNYPLEEIPFDFHELIAALAPRVCFVNAPLGDSNFKWKSAAAVVDAAMPIYQLYEVPERLQIEHPDAGHSFPEPQRRAAYALLHAHLR